MKVSAIIPAFNEEKKIRNVLTILTHCELIDEVICVDDCSKDATSEIAKSFEQIKVITLTKNQGKANALMQGVAEAKGDIVLFVDADLSGLSNAIMTSLINPLRSGQYDICIGYKNGTKLDNFFIPLAGERAYFKKDILPLTEQIKNKGFGLELYLNYVFKDKKTKLIRLREVKHTLKYAKYSYMLATTNMLKEINELLTEIVRQKNPFTFLYYSYLYQFYIKPRHKG